MNPYGCERLGSQLGVAVLLAVMLAWSPEVAAQRAAEDSTLDPTLERQVQLQRFRMLTYEDLTPRQREDWDDFATIRPGSNPGNIAWNAFLRVPDLADTMVRLRVHFLSDELQVSKRIYEWATIVTGRYWTANHEWNAHAPAALLEGVKPQTVRSLGEGRRPVQMATDEELAYDFLHELWEHQHVTDTTYEKALAVFGEEGMMELVAIQALYGAISAAHAVINAQELTNELAPFTNRFNPPASATPQQASQ